MKYPSIDERLEVISELIQQRLDLHEYLELQRKVLQVQLEIDTTPNKGVRADWGDRPSISSLEEKALKAKKPIVYFLNPTIFDAVALASTFRKVAKILIDAYPDDEGLRKLLDQVDARKPDLMKLVEAALREDEAPIMDYAGKFEVEPPLLLYLVSVPIQPFIEELARQASPSFYERWWQAPCPICGRTPNVARIRNRKRYLMCTFCGAEYLSDYFLCANCGNKDPYTLKYLIIEGKPGFQIDFCTKCNHYVKVIVENALKEPIPRCLEDMLTLDLDIEAKHAGLVRTG